MAAVSAFIRALPKVQLHCHLEGTLRPETFRALAERYGLQSPRVACPPAQTYAFANFGEFLLLFAEISKVLRAPADFARLASDFVADAAAQNVRHAEVFVSPSVWTFFHRELDVRATVSAIRETLDREGARQGLDVLLICDLTRNFGPERAFETAQTAVSLRDLGVVAIGLGGDEAKCPPAWFAEAFAFAREHGLHCVAHAGEAAGAESVRDALHLLKAERIGHGVRALEDDALVDELAASGIALELCPTSNRLTGVAPADLPHPIATLDARGVRCTIDADDPALFSTTLCDEYAIVADLMGEAALVRLAGNGIDASFAPAERKTALHRELAAFGLEMAAGRRTP